MSGNRAYRKGADFERRVRKIIESEGGFVVRSAGSKGVFDLIAIYPDGKIFGIQCKRSGSLSRKEIERMLDISSKYPIIPIFATIKNRRITFIDVRKIEKFK